MALIIGFESLHGLDTPLYWRLNNVEQFGNREPDGSRIPAIVRFRAYVSEAAFRDGKNFLEEELVEFIPSSASADLASEAYAAFKAMDPSQQTGEELEDVQANIERAKRDERAAKNAIIEAPKGSERDEAKREAKRATERREAAEAAELVAAGRHEKAKARRQAVVQAVAA